MYNSDGHADTSRRRLHRPHVHVQYVTADKGRDNIYIVRI